MAFEELFLDDEPHFDIPLDSQTDYFSPEKDTRIPPTQNRLMSVITSLSIGIVGLLTGFAVITLSANEQQREMMGSESITPAFEDTKREIQAGPGVLFALAIGAGFLICFFGYRLLRPAFFLTGFVAGAIVCYDVFHKVFGNGTYSDITTAVVVVLGGLVVGFAIVLLYEIGVFILGVVAGIAFSEYLHTSILYKIYPEEPNLVLYSAMIIFGLAFGAIAYFNERPLSIACTSWIGSYILIRGIGYFAGGYPVPTSLKTTYNSLRGGKEIRIPGEWWGYFFATLIVFGLGLLIQIRYTAKDIYQVIRSKKKNNNEPTSRRSMSTAEQNCVGAPTQLV